MDRSQRSASGLRQPRCSVGSGRHFRHAAPAVVAADAVSSRRCASSSRRPRGLPSLVVTSARLRSALRRRSTSLSSGILAGRARAGSITLSTELPPLRRGPACSAGQALRSALVTMHSPQPAACARSFCDRDGFTQAAGRRLADDITCVWGEGLVPSEGRPAASQSALPAT